EDLPGAQRTVVLSYGTWQTRYGGRRDVLVQTITLDGEPTVIIGVLPREFHFAPAGTPEFWGVVNGTGVCEKRRSCHNLYGIARLGDGVTQQGAQGNVTSIAQQLEKQYPDSNRDRGAALTPLSELVVGNIRPILLA